MGWGSEFRMVAFGFRVQALPFRDLPLRGLGGIPVHVPESSVSGTAVHDSESRKMGL